MNEQVDNALGGHGFATVTSTQVGAVNDIAKRLRIKADMIQIGERIQWGSETALMYEAADYIDAVSEPLYTRDELVEIVAASICDAQLWLGAWLRANEPERGMYRHMAAGVVTALLATGQLKVRE